MWASELACVVRWATSQKLRPHKGFLREISSTRVLLILKGLLDEFTIHISNSIHNFCLPMEIAALVPNGNGSTRADDVQWTVTLFLQITEYVQWVFVEERLWNAPV